MAFIGSVEEIEVIFRNTSGALANPTTVTATAKKPDGTIVAGTAVNVAVGRYDLLYDADLAGLWFWRVVGEGGSVDAVVEGSFCVNETSVA